MMRPLTQLFGIKPIRMHYTMHECHLQNVPWMNIIFLHSMLSSSRTAFPIQSFIKPFSRTLSCALNYNIRCYLLDARNHGLSPHSNTFCLESICVDLNEFIETHTQSSDPLILLGHSMGGKASLLYALLRESDVTGLISLDASPTIYTHNHQQIFNAMQAINIAQINHKNDANQQLKLLGITNASERAFILDNLVVNAQNEWSWQCNLDAIHDRKRTSYSWLSGYKTYGSL
eukprot:1032260_1